MHCSYILEHTNGIYNIKYKSTSCKTFSTKYHTTSATDGIGVLRSAHMLEYNNVRIQINHVITMSIMPHIYTYTNFIPCRFFRYIYNYIYGNAETSQTSRHGRSFFDSSLEVYILFLFYICIQKYLCCSIKAYIYRLHNTHLH